MSALKEVSIGFIGAGTVGGGAIEIIRRHCKEYVVHVSRYSQSASAGKKSFLRVLDSNLW